MKGLEQIVKSIKILVLDVDGVLTDGGVYYDTRGQIIKRFNVQDGLGIKVAQQAGLQLAVISGLISDAVRLRLEELGVQDYFLGHNQKIPALIELQQKYNLNWDEMAYLGDDWVDAAPMQKVGLPMAVANAVPEIKELALWISSRKGGDGAVREAISFILKGQGKLLDIWNKWASWA
ncbi:MAG: HAD-IIIA family hydrolase [Desulfonauticus sp.]|nr:HAD-IIIA family hydrolase [Desulfonauticus sp.]